MRAGTRRSPPPEGRGASLFYPDLVFAEFCDTKGRCTRSQGSDDDIDSTPQVTDFLAQFPKFFCLPGAIEASARDATCLDLHLLEFPSRRRGNRAPPLIL